MQSWPNWWKNICNQKENGQHFKMFWQREVFLSHLRILWKFLITFSHFRRAQTEIENKVRWNMSTSLSLTKFVFYLNLRLCAGEWCDESLQWIHTTPWIRLIVKSLIGEEGDIKHHESGRWEGATNLCRIFTNQIYLNNITISFTYK